MEDIKKFFETLIHNETFILVSKILLIIAIIYYVIIVVSLWNIFKKEGRKPWLSLIPFVNFYYLFVSCRLPFIVLFIPIANIVILFLFPYRLAKQYKCNMLLRIVAVLFPFIMVPYIAYSKLTNIDTRYKMNTLKTIDDVFGLEGQLGRSNDVIIDDSFVIDSKPKKSNINTFADDIEAQIINDDIVYEDQVQETVVQSTEEDIEMLDLNVTDSTTINDIETLEKSIEVNSQIEKNTEEVVETLDPKSWTTDTAIAFGGTNKLEGQTNAKNDELKCPRCGASLVGAKDHCPGCGASI